MTNQTTGHRNQTGAYAELNVGVMATGETTDTENQYDALKHRDNYLTMKTIGNKGGTKTSECKDCYINMNFVWNMATRYNNTIDLSAIKPQIPDRIVDLIYAVYRKIGFPYVNMLFDKNDRLSAFSYSICMDIWLNNSASSSFVFNRFVFIQLLVYVTNAIK